MTSSIQPGRVADWDRRLARVIEHHSEQPGGWAVSDCWVMTLDAIEAVTGERMFPKLRKYKTEAGGYKLFAKQGFTTVEQALASALPRVGILSAMRGDVGVIERDGVISSGVIDADGFAVKTLYGDAKAIVRSEVLRYPVTAIKAAFKVGRP